MFRRFYRKKGEFRVSPVVTPHPRAEVHEHEVDLAALVSVEESVSTHRATAHPTDYVLI